MHLFLFLVILTGFFSSKMLHVETVDTPAKQLCREEHERICRETVKKAPTFYTTKLDTQCSTPLVESMSFEASMLV